MALRFLPPPDFLLAYTGSLSNNFGQLFMSTRNLAMANANKTLSGPAELKDVAKRLVEHHEKSCGIPTGLLTNQFLEAVEAALNACIDASPTKKEAEQQTDPFFNAMDTAIAAALDQHDRGVKSGNKLEESLNKLVTTIASGGNFGIYHEILECQKIASKERCQAMAIVRVLDSPHLSLERKLTAAHLCLRFTSPFSEPPTRASSLLQKVAAQEGPEGTVARFMRGEFDSYHFSS